MSNKVLGISLAAAVLLAAPAALATEYVNDPLTAPAFAGRGSKGGTFGANGWTTSDGKDSVWYEVPDALESGSVTYTVTGLSLTTTLTGGDHDILALYQAPTGVSEPIGYSPWYRDNDFKVFTRIKGAMDAAVAGKVKLEVFRCPRGEPWYHSTPCDAGCGTDDFAYSPDEGWDPAASYVMGVSWAPGVVRFSRDGVELGHIDFTGTYAPQPLRVRIGSPRNDYDPEMPIGITIKDVKVSGTKGAMTPLCAASSVGAGGGAGAGGAGAGGTGAGGASSGMALSPLADVTAASWQTGVFPDVTDLNVEGDGTSPTGIVYLRFPPPPGPVAKATLEMRTHVFDSAAGVTGTIHGVMDGTWSETTLTWATKPAYAAPPFGTAVMVGADTLAGWDVTALVNAGVTNFALVSTASDGAHFRSKEEPTGEGPRLVVELATGGAGGSVGVGGGSTAGTGGASAAGATGAGAMSAGGAAGKSAGGSVGASGATSTGGKGGFGASGGSFANGGKSGGALVQAPSNEAAPSTDRGGCGCHTVSSRGTSLAPLGLGLLLALRMRKRAQRRLANNNPRPATTVG